MDKKMTQNERRKYLIAVLLKEQPQYSEIAIPASEQEQKFLLRSLFNIRMPLPVTDEFLTRRLFAGGITAKRNYNSI